MLKQNAYSHFFMPTIQQFSFFSISLLILPFSIFAQPSDEYQKSYLNGRNAFKEGNYHSACEFLLPLTAESLPNSFAIPSAYLYALSTFKLGDFERSKGMCLQTLQRYPTWEKRDELYYLLSNTYFEQQKPRLAIQFLNKTETLKNDIEQLKKTYYDKITALDTLIALQKDYPSDNLLATSLAERLAKSYSSTEKNKMLLHFLVQEYKLKINELVNEPKSVLKNSYKVALLFPFQLNEIETKISKRSNQYILDFYEGLKIAVDTLRSRGISLEIFAYDTEKEASIINSIIILPELKTMDLIIGPVFPVQIPIVTTFCQENKIININPFSANSKITENNEFTLLFQPTLEIQAGISARYANEYFRQDSTYSLTYSKSKYKEGPKDRTKVIIFYGNEVKDSLLATYHRDSCLSNKLNVIHFEKINRSRVSLLNSILGDTSKLGKINHVFVTTSDEVIAANIISLIEVSRQNTPVITKSDWLTFNLISYEQFEKRNVFFIQTDFYDYSSPLFKNFKSSFTSRTKIYPTYHAVQGFELMMYFGEALYRYGTYFKTGLNAEGFTKGKILGGFDFSNSYANRYVTISRFKDRNLLQMNIGIEH